ncbi:hypothetical protein BB561_003262 [Smittium simulii]|uniref:Tyrosine--tRNA ligase n=1 Tax=Smittium simulii TaxID=133385 RepID=A0A2T9YMB0_9FUNG|nr:hypothetical protein BB561_003262 [Smittium simulii]
MLSRSLSIQKSLFSAHIYRPFSTNVIQTLKDRGLVENITNEKLAQKTLSPITVYCGVDPTATSMHLGNLLTMMSLFHFYLHGHQVIPLVGGATGIIGDPTGRETERTSLTKLQLEENVKGIQAQLKTFFVAATKYAQKRIPVLNTTTIKPLLFVNNHDWYQNMNIVDFLKLVGRNSRVKTMLARDSVKSRLDCADGGMTFTEFSYQLFQAYDFYFLHKNYNCCLQIGGSDQWGNITAGIDLISRINNQSILNSDNSAVSPNSKDAYGLTIPLLVSKSGKKFGKSAGNAVWLDSSLTSPYEFYQYFMRTPDSDLEILFKNFTLLPLNDIQTLLDKHNERPENKIGQSTLAAEITELVHGDELLEKAIYATSYLFGKSTTGHTDPNKNNNSDQLKPEYLISALRGDQRLTFYNHSKIKDLKITDIAIITKACKSKNETIRLIKNKGLYWNNKRVTSADWIPDINTDYFGSPKIAVLRVGKAFFHVLALE